MSRKDKNPPPPRPPGKGDEHRPFEELEDDVTKTEFGFEPNERDESNESTLDETATNPEPPSNPAFEETGTETVAREDTNTQQAGPERDSDPAASTSASQQTEATGPAAFIPGEFPDDGETMLEGDLGTETGSITRIEVPGTPAPDEPPTTPPRAPDPFDDVDEDTMTRGFSEGGDEPAPVLRYDDGHETGTGDLTATDFFGGFNEPEPDVPGTETDVHRASADEPSTQTDVHRALPDDSTQTDVRPRPSADPQTETAPAPDPETATVDPLETATAAPPNDETDTIAPPLGDETVDIAPPDGGPRAPLNDETVEIGHADLPLFPKTLHEPHDDSEEDETADDGTVPTPVRRHPRRRASDRRRKGIVARVGEWLDEHVDVRTWWANARAKYDERAERTRRIRTENKIDRASNWWRRTITEVGILYAIIIPIELVVSGGNLGSFGVHPHPYWLIILPMAAARGVVAGMLSAAVASIMYFVGGIQALGADEFATIFTYGNMMEPILFFAVAYFTGEVHDEMELRRHKLKRQLEDVRERIKSLRQERDVLADANKQLERRIVDDSVQFGNLIVAARRIEQAGRGEVLELALELVDEHCGASASVLILLDDGSLDLFCQKGWTDDETAARLTAARSSGFVQRAIAEGEVVNGFRPEEAPTADGPLVVAPLFDAGGVVKALLCLDDVPATRLNESTITVFCGIAEWVSAALARLARGADAPAPRARALEPAPESDLYMGTVAALGERLRLELERCSRYGVPTSFLAIQASEWTDTSTEGSMILDRFVLTHFTSGLRPSDAIYRFGYPACYLLVLAGTTIEGAEIVRTRLLRRVEFSPVQNIGAIEIFATGPDIEAPDLLSLAQRVAGRFRGFSSLPLDGRCPITVPDTGRPGRLDEFLHRLRMETSLAVRNGFELHVVGVTADGDEGDGNSLLARHVFEAGERTLRPSDGVYTIGPRHCCVILPCTGSKEAATVAHRLVTAVRKRDPDAPYGNLETQVLGLGASHPDAGSFLQALAKRQS